MNIQFENKDSVLKENCFITGENCGIYGWYGLSYFEVILNGTTLQDLYELKECVETMIEEVERLNKIQGLTKCQPYDIIKKNKKEGEFQMIKKIGWYPW